MKKVKYLILVFCLSSVNVFASDLIHEITGQLNGKTLTLNFKEKEAIAAGCDLYVQKFVYYPDFKTIDLVLREVKNCPLDNIAPRSAQLQWNVPFNFTAEKNITLKLNHRTVGTLIIENQSVVFKPRGN